MPLEIERKYLIISNEYRNNSTFTEITQAYLSISNKMAIRIRINGLQASLAIKSKISERINREYEYNIPIDEARSIMNLDSLPIINKVRYQVEYESHIWEVDEFHGKNDGLVIAEIELEDEYEEFKKPPWLGQEVTADTRYLNSNLAVNPFKEWH